MRSQLHRLRFVDYAPSGIVALALHPSGAYLAIARENADLELWACDRGGFDSGTTSGTSAASLSVVAIERGLAPQAWLLLCAIPGSPRVAIRGMTWVDLASPTPSAGAPAVRAAAGAASLGAGVDGCRLLACSLNGSIAEADWAGRQLHSLCDSAGGAAWCIASWPLALAAPMLQRARASSVSGSSEADDGGAAAPLLLPNAGVLVAVGCEDGGVRLFRARAPPAELAPALPGGGAAAGLLSTASGRRAAAGVCDLQLVATCPGTDGRILSLALHPTLPVLFSGSAAGALRGWDLTGTALAAMAPEVAEALLARGGGGGGAEGRRAGGKARRAGAGGVASASLGAAPGTADEEEEEEDGAGLGGRLTALNTAANAGHEGRPLARVRTRPGVLTSVGAGGAGEDSDSDAEAEGRGGAAAAAAAAAAGHAQVAALLRGGGAAGGAAGDGFAPPSAPVPLVRMTGTAAVSAAARASSAAAVWALALTSDLLLLAGDSSGAVAVWDARTGTLALPGPLVRHDGDVLALAVREGPPAAPGGPPALVVASAGVDGRVVLSRRIPSGKPAASARAPPAGGRWVTLGSHAGHAHDVRALAIPSDGGAVLSGSADGMVGLLRVAEVATRRPARVLPFYQRPLASVAAAPGTRLLAVQGAAGALEVWGVGEAAAGAASAEGDAAAPGEGGAEAAVAPRKGGRSPGSHALLLSIEAQAAGGGAARTGGAPQQQRPVGGSPAGLAVSPDGRWLACADPAAPGGGLRLLWLDVAKRRDGASALRAPTASDDEEGSGETACEGVPDVEDAVAVPLPPELSAALAGCGCPSQLAFAAPLPQQGGAAEGCGAWLLAVFAQAAIHVVLCGPAGALALLGDAGAAEEALRAGGGAGAAAGEKRRRPKSSSSEGAPAAAYLYSLAVPLRSVAPGDAEATQLGAEAAGLPGLAPLRAAAAAAGAKGGAGAAAGGRAATAIAAKAPAPSAAASRTAIRLPGGGVAAPLRPASLSLGSESDGDASSDAGNTPRHPHPPATPPAAGGGRAAAAGGGTASNRRARRLERVRSREGAGAGRFAPVFVTAVASAALGESDRKAGPPPSSDLELALALAAPSAAAALAIATHRAQLFVFRLGVGGGSLLSSPARLPCAATALLLARLPSPAGARLFLVAALRSGGLAACDAASGASAPWARAVCEAFAGAWGPVSSDASGSSGGGGGGGAIAPASTPNAAEPVRQLLGVPCAPSSSSAPSQPLLHLLAVGGGGHVCSLKLSASTPSSAAADAAGEPPLPFVATAAVLPARFTNVLCAALLSSAAAAASSVAAGQQAAAAAAAALASRKGHKARNASAGDSDAAAAAAAPAAAALDGKAAAGDLAVVELPWRVYSSHLAAVVHRKKYGS